MFFLRLTEIFGIILFVVLFVTQLLFPLMDGRQTFPLFRKKRKQLETEIADLNTTLDDQHLADVARYLRSQVEPTESASADTVAAADKPISG